MKKETRLKCWQCGTPYDFSIRKELGPETLRAIVKGVRRKRYLKYCLVCVGGLTDPDKVEEQEPVRPMVLPGVGAGWRYMKNKHLLMIDHRCQICGKKDRNIDIYPNVNKKMGRYLQRDVIALCLECLTVVGHRLASQGDRP